MNKATLSLSLRIAQLLHDNSENDLRDAVEVLRKYGYSGEFLSFLAEYRSSERKINRVSSSTKTKPVEETRSRAVLILKNKEPEKFRVLSEFDSMVRRGQLLPKHEDLKRFGERLSKSFEPKKARKETIGVLMAVLAERSVNEVEELIQFAASFGISGATDEYQRLARFLIKGKDQSQNYSPSAEGEGELDIRTVKDN
jgi:hypothetical protein